MHSRFFSSHVRRSFGALEVAAHARAWQKPLHNGLVLPACLHRRTFTSEGQLATDVEVIQKDPHGLLVSSTTSSSSRGTARGKVFEHEGSQWVLVFEVDTYWFAAPLAGSVPGKVGWTRGAELNLKADSADAATSSIAVQCLLQPTPSQAERAQLSQSMPSGVMAVDVLAPIGMGQSILICGPRGTGKSTLAKQVLEQALTGRQVDKALRFYIGPCAPPVDPALQRAGALAELVATSGTGGSMEDASPALLAPLFEAVGAAEAVRNAGQHALLVLDTVAPLLSAWDLAVRMADSARGSPGDPDSIAAQRRSCFAGLFERAANLQSGGTLTMLVLMETDMMAALSIPGSTGAVKASAGTGAQEFSLSDFEGRKESELERLRRLQERGVALTAQALSAVGISLPQSSPEGAEIGASGGKAVREMQSLSDGQIILEEELASQGIFPATVPGATFSRFGLGSSGTGAAAAAESLKRRDVRPPALQAVAAHLRTLLALEQEAHFRPRAEAIDSLQSAQMKAVCAAMRQPPDAPLQPEEMTALLLAACGGALDALPGVEAASSLSSGAQSPLLRHLQEAAPQVLRKIAEEPHLSNATIRELEVAVRLFVKLKQAGGS
eukprot:TRINITY_DN77884_c0_g1_i1.p1 TRINITY_DN77884_c0_g1~~TRINITY_DN77884_c0_g1_i1.p1  ORF type:complete len:611 (+),score=140.12 TRINITY_DN77884_c0_g1_i1:54-1886(+)